MIKNYKNFSLFILSIFVMFYLSVILSNDLQGTLNNIENMYFLTFSYSFLGQEISIMNIIQCFLLIAINVSIFADDISDELGRNAQYIFTRTTKRRKWILNKFSNILFKLIVVQAIQFILAFIHFKILGYEIYDFIMFSKNICVLFIFRILVQYTLILIINVLSLKLSDIYSYMVGIVFFFVSIIYFHTSYLQNGKLMKYIPLTQHIIKIIQPVNMNDNINNAMNFIPNYNPVISIVYSVIFVSIWIVIGTKLIKTKEFY